MDDLMTGSEYGDLIASGQPDACIQLMASRAAGKPWSEMSPKERDEMRKHITRPGGSFEWLKRCYG